MWELGLIKKKKKKKESKVLESMYLFIFKLK